MEIVRHSIWTALHGEIQFTEFKQNVLPKIRFKEEVHADVIKSFEVVEKLLDHSFYEYEFIDVATAKGFHIFEMACKIRYSEVSGKDWKNGSLKNLLEWLNSNYYFEVLNPHFIDHVRNVRNHFSHPSQYGFGGIALLHWFDTLVDLINDLYEDPILRQERLTKTKEYQVKFDDLISKGSVFCFGDIRINIFDIRVLLYDNKISNQAVLLIGLEEYLVYTQSNYVILRASITDFTIENGKLEQDDLALIKMDNTVVLADQTVEHNIQHSIQVDSVFKRLRKEFHFY